MLGRDSRQLGVVLGTVVLLGALFAVFLGAAAGPVWALAFAAALGGVVARWGWKLGRPSRAARPAEAEAADGAPAGDGISRLPVLADPGCPPEGAPAEVETPGGGPPRGVLVGPARP